MTPTIRGGPQPICSPSLCRRTAILFLALAAFAASTAALSVLPLGDSITRGDASADSADGSYRYYLDRLLAGAGYDVDLVGSTTAPTYTRLSFDQDHDGHGGYTTGMFLSYGGAEPLRGWLGAYPPPDVVLLMIGTNDAIRQVPLMERLENLRGIVAVLRERSPNVTVLVARIIPTGDAFRNSRQVDPFNAALPGVVQNLTTPRSRVLLVDQHSGYDGTADNGPDGIHPNRAGMEKIAARWYAALTPLLPGPSPVVVPGGAGAARDLDGDGRREDVNGNGREDFADVVLYFNQMSWIAANAPLEAFDYNENGRIDFADVVRLFNLVG